jgi:hypothetical protein
MAVHTARANNTESLIKIGWLIMATILMLSEDREHRKVNRLIPLFGSLQRGGPKVSTVSNAQSANVATSYLFRFARFETFWKSPNAVS